MSHAALTEKERHDLARLRRVRDRIDREFALPLNVEELARSAHMSAGHLSRQFRAAYGVSPYSYLMTRRIERAMARVVRVLLAMRVGLAPVLLRIRAGRVEFGGGDSSFSHRDAPRLSRPRLEQTRSPIRQRPEASLAGRQEAVPEGRSSPS